MSAGRLPSSARLQLLDVSFRLEADWPDALDLLNRLYTTPEFRQPAADAAIHARFHRNPDSGGGCRVEVDGSDTVLALSGNPEESISEWVFQSFLRNSKGFTLIHAAALARHGRGTLVVGGPHAGKTTLAIALAHHGLDYYSDDVAPLSRNDGYLHPFRRAAGVRLEGGVRRYELPGGPSGTTVDSAPPRPCPLGWVFFLEPRPAAGSSPEGAVTLLEQVPPDQAAIELLTHTMNREPYGLLGASYGEHPHLKACADLLAAVATARCYRLSAGRPDEAARTLISLMDDAHQRPSYASDRPLPAGSNS